MDRVLIAVDQLQFASHLEMTLRKVGFDVESISIEYNLSEKLLTFNPDMIIVRGQGPKISSLNIGKKLKDQIKYTGKVILIFSNDFKISPEELSKIRSDLLLFEPMGALKLTMNILNLDPARKEMMQDRLYRMAELDSHFRTQEQAYLVAYGHDLDRDLIQIQGRISEPDQDLLISEDIVSQFVPKVENHDVSSDLLNNLDLELNKEYLEKLKLELKVGRDELSLRIDTYNHQIKTIDKDLKKGLERRQTKGVLKKQRLELEIDPGFEKLENLDLEKQKFTQALFKK